MDSELTKLRAVIVASCPELHSARFDLHIVGWDSFAVDVDDRLIFKFPRHTEAEMRLKAEAGLLAALRPKVTMADSDLVWSSSPTITAI